MPSADRILDAQVAFHLDRLTGPEAEHAVRRLAASLLDGAGSRPFVDLVDVDDVKESVTRVLTSAPDGAAVHLVVDVVREVVRAGPQEPFRVDEVVDRAQVEAVVDALLALTPAAERALDRLSTSPVVSAVATRFMARVVGEALKANQAAAEKVPGIGGLLSLGATLATGVATGAVGAADKQLDGLLGQTVGRGGSLAAGRLNKIVLETLRDPATREAVLQAWDVAAASQVRGTDDLRSAEELTAVADAVRDLVSSTLAHPHTLAMAHQVVDGLVEGYGGYSPLELLTELGVERDELLDDLVRRTPQVVAAWRASGELEAWLRAELGAFWATDEAAALLAD
ncbi:hypothetical protein [Nocardioides litoris]|uniref:hypothetical protein n=1 Tax=Nocardioides litoris TaxID=1926648 RepID=UPI00111FA893|nr:hypothetical protein [Nocardioides litoris]